MMTSQEEGECRLAFLAVRRISIGLPLRRRLKAGSSVISAVNTTPVTTSCAANECREAQGIEIAAVIQWAKPEAQDKPEPGEGAIHPRKVLTLLEASGATSSTIPETFCQKQSSLSATRFHSSQRSVRSTNLGHPVRPLFPETSYRATAINHKGRPPSTQRQPSAGQDRHHWE